MIIPPRGAGTTHVNYQSYDPCAFAPTFTPELLDHFCKDVHENPMQVCRECNTLFHHTVALSLGAE